MLDATMPEWAKLAISAVLLVALVVLFFWSLGRFIAAVEWLQDLYQRRSATLRKRFRGTIGVFLALGLGGFLLIALFHLGVRIAGWSHRLSATRQEDLLHHAKLASHVSLGCVGIALIMVFFTTGLKRRRAESVRRLLEEGDIAAALRELEDVRHEPGQNVSIDSEIACLYAYALVLSGQVQEALEHLEASERHLQGSVRFQKWFPVDEHRGRWNVESLELQRLRIGNILCELGYFEEALRLAESETSQTRSEISRHWLRGMALLGQGDLAGARESLLSALRVSQFLADDAEVQKETAQIRLSLGECYLLDGRYGEAIQVLQQAREFLAGRVFEGHPDLIEAQCLLARVYAVQKKARLAGESFEAALKRELKFLVKAAASMRERDLLRLIHRMQVHLEQYLSHSVAQALRDAGAIHRALEQVFQRKGLALQARLWTHRPESGPAPVRRRLEAVRRQLSEALFSSSAAALGETVTALEAEREALENELARSGRAEDLYPKLQEITVEAVQARVPEDSLLVEIVAARLDPPGSPEQRSEPHYLAFVLPPGPGAPALFDLGLAEPIDDLVRRFHDEMETFKRWSLASLEGARDLASRGLPRSNRYRQLGRALFDRLVGPWLPLGVACKRWIISPDAGLSFVPFPALLTPEDRFLIEHVETRIVSSGRDLLRGVPARRADEPVALLVGDPAFTPPRLRTAPLAEEPTRGPYVIDPLQRKRAWFSPLPGTGREIREIAQILQESRVVSPEIRLGARATKDAVLGVRRPLLLHLATHAFFLPAHARGAEQDVHDFLSGGSADGKGSWGRIAISAQSPYLRSGLAFAGANSRREGMALLTAEEVLSMDLRGTDLVVLSACQTALGMIMRGEGVLGLHRAFMIAGALNVLASLWKVPDSETVILMSRFYVEYLKTGDKGKALRAAMLELIEELRQSGEECHPALWSAFFCFGPPRASLRPL